MTTFLPSRYWTADEIELALAHETYEDFIEAGGQRGPVAFRHKRSRLLRALEANPPEPPAPAIAPIERGSDSIDAYYQQVKALTAVHLERVDRQRVIEWSPDTAGWVGIVFLGDLHIGGPILYDCLEADLDLIERTPGCYAVGMGDYAENFSGQPKLLQAMAETVVPSSDTQAELVVHRLSRLRKWILVVMGNHDGWLGPRGIESLASALQAEFATEAGASLKCTVGDHRYVLYVKHQWKGHSNLNTSNESRRFWSEFADFENADATILAHYHQPDSHVKEIKNQSVAHLRGGTYKLFDEYAFRGGFRPAYGPSMILLNPQEHELIPWHGPQWRRGVELLAMLRKQEVSR